MGSSCTTPPSNKKEYISDIGKILLETKGKQNYYKPEEVKEAHRKSKWYDGVDFSCWAMSVFSTHTDFDQYHSDNGEICSYTEMKIAMLSDLSLETLFDFRNNSDVDIDSGWLDFGEAFDGIGEFIGGIFEEL